MRRYGIGFWGTYLLAMALSVGMFFLALANWLFSDTPPWFDMLWVVVMLLPFLAMGDFLAHKGTAPKKQRRKALIVHVVIQLGLAVLGSFWLGESVLQVIVWPGTLPGTALREMLDYNGYWDAAFPLVSHALLPVFYHLGWAMGKPNIEE